jgi:hypothetical protein
VSQQYIVGGRMHIRTLGVPVWSSWSTCELHPAIREPMSIQLATSRIFVSKWLGGKTEIDEQALSPGHFIADSLSQISSSYRLSHHVATYCTHHRCLGAACRPCTHAGPGCLRVSACAGRMRAAFDLVAILQIHEAQVGKMPTCTCWAVRRSSLSAAFLSPLYASCKCSACKRRTYTTKLPPPFSYHRGKRKSEGKQEWSIWLPDSLELFILKIKKHILSFLKNLKKIHTYRQ